MRISESLRNFDWKGRVDSIGNYLFSYSAVKTLNSALLIFLMMIFVKFFLIGVDQKLIVGFFEVLVCFGMIIILFSIVPVVLNGWGGIVNILIMVFGVLYFVDDSYANLFFSTIKVGVLFAGLHFLWHVKKYYEATRAEAESFNVPDYGDERKPRRRRVKR